MSGGYWHLPKRPTVIVIAAVLAVMLAPRLLAQVEPPKPAPLTIVNEGTVPRIVLVVETKDMLSGKAWREWSRVDAGTRIRIDSLTVDMEVAVLVFDTACHIVSPWPFSVSPPLGTDIAAVFDDRGDPAWGDASESVSYREAPIVPARCPSWP